MSNHNRGAALRRVVIWLLMLSFVLSAVSVAVLAKENTQVPDTDVGRIFGSTRYETATKSADAVSGLLGKDKLDTVILASGLDFADALAGSYLAVVKDAPILLSNGKNTDQLHSYIRLNVKQGGTVYILGGEKALPASIAKGLTEYTVKRLSGATRYETNLAIIQEAGIASNEILVCTGLDFADSLSASAVGKPILLVNNKNGALTQSQKEFLTSIPSSRIYILGGTAAVGEKLEAQLRCYGTVERIGGATRYETSVLVAEKFFPQPQAAVLSYALTYPDGLCGGLRG